MKRLSELVAKLPPGPWVLVRRSNPGWRVEEARGGKLIAYGQEGVEDAYVGQALVALREDWETVEERLEGLEHARDAYAEAAARSRREADDLARRNAQLVEFVIDAAEYFEEWGEPDWFLRRARELVASAGPAAGAAVVS